jgi:DSF synthase
MNAICDFPVFDVRHTYDTIQLELVRELNTLVSWMKSNGSRACFTPTLLHDIEASEKLIETHEGYVFDGTTQAPVDYVVFASKTAGVFNLGGDLGMFIDAVVARDRQKINHYAKLCIGNLYRRYSGFGAGITTIALVQGKALGGGFECALASDFIVAERSATFALPEVLFNLFPGMGALSFLSRKVGARKAEELCLSGETYSAREMHTMGIVDVLCEDGEGMQAVRSFIRGRSRYSKAQKAIARARQLVDRVTRKELDDVVDVWTDAVLRLEAKDLRMMSRLVRAQDKLTTGQREADEPSEMMVAPMPIAVNG